MAKVKNPMLKTAILARLLDDSVKGATALARQFSKAQAVWAR